MVYLATPPETEVELDQRTEAMFDLVNYKPWPEQKRIIACKARFIIVTGGEQGGKSQTVSEVFLSRWPQDMQNKWNGNQPLIYWLVGPDYANTQAEFDFIRDDFVNIFGENAVRASKRVDPGYIEIWFTDDLGNRESRPRIRIDTKSATDPRKLTRVAPNGIIACEASQMDLVTFERLRGRCAPRQAWLILSGTLEGSLGWYPTVAEAWKQGQDDKKSFELPSWANRTLYPGGRNDPEILSLEEESSDTYFMERIAGRRVPPRGLVFGEFRADIHVESVEWVPDEPVYLFVDPGYSGAHALEVGQKINGRFQIFDEIYEHLITEDMIAVAIDREWWASISSPGGAGGFGVIDVAGRQHQAMAAPVEVWLSKAGLYMSSQRVLEAEGRERLKSFLKPDPLTGRSKLVIDPKCRGILSEFGVMTNPFDGQERPYRWKTDREGNIVGSTPEDKNNHGIKALTYGLVDLYGYSKAQNRGKFLVKRF